MNQKSCEGNMPHWHVFSLVILSTSLKTYQGIGLFFWSQICTKIHCVFRELTCSGSSVFQEGSLQRLSARFFTCVESKNMIWVLCWGSKFVSCKIIWCNYFSVKYSFQIGAYISSILNVCKHVFIIWWISVFCNILWVDIRRIHRNDAQCIF